MSVEMSGFDDFIGKLNNAGKNIEHNIDNAVHRTAQILRTYTVKGIRDQAFNFAPLSPKYAAWKKAHGGGSKTLISGIRSAKTSAPKDHYVSSFSVEKLESSIYLVGSNYPQANALEHGFEAKGLPARPHLGPAYEKTEKPFAEELQKAIEEAFSS